MKDYLERILEYFKKNYLGIMAIFLSIMGIVLTITLFIYGQREVSEDITESDTLVSTQVEEEEKAVIKVDVKGEVNNPGVYVMDEGTIVLDAINKAGGLTKNATTSDINLSKILVNEMIITVLTKSNGSSTSKTTSSGGSSSKTSSKVSINNGSLSDLMTLTGIGEAKAKSIISYRQKNGLFAAIEDIKNVSGIGEALFAKIKEDITT